MLAEKDPETLITGAVALARQGDKSLQPRLLTALDRSISSADGSSGSWSLLRAYSLVFIRMGYGCRQAARKLAEEVRRVLSRPDRPAQPRAVQAARLSQVADGRRQDARPDAAGIDRRRAERMDDLLARNQGYGGTIAKMLANGADPQKLHLRVRAAERRRTAGRWTSGSSTSVARRRTAQAAAAAATRASSTTSRKTPSRTPPTPSAWPSRRPASASRSRRRRCPSRQGPGRDWTLAELVASRRTQAPGPQLQERPEDVRGRALRRLPSLRRRRRRHRPRPDPGRRPLQLQGPHANRSSSRARWSRTSTRRRSSPPTAARSTPAGSSTSRTTR